jgi:hypothetical protein
MTVQEFVAAAHGDLDTVRTAVEENPGLVNAAWDWGDGDWETGLGALFLLDNGARLDLFAAAMLGYADVVRAALAAHPGLREAKGPHGIPLITHAEAGGARGVLDLLVEGVAVG